MQFEVMSSLQELAALVAPPNNPIGTGSPEKWAGVEQELGMPLPPDYKALVNRYGAGRFADWIGIHSPFVPAGSSNLLSMTEAFSGLYREGFRIRPDDMPPFPPFPASGGLLPWAGDDNGSEFCWVTSGTSEDWIVVNLDADYTLEDYRVLPYTATELLTGWFAGRIIGDWYPENLKPTQRRYFIAQRQ